MFDPLHWVGTCLHSSDWWSCIVSGAAATRQIWITFNKSRGLPESMDTWIISSNMRVKFELHHQMGCPSWPRLYNQCSGLKALQLAWTAWVAQTKTCGSNWKVIFIGKSLGMTSIKWGLARSGHTFSAPMSASHHRHVSRLLCSQEVTRTVQVREGTCYFFEAKFLRKLYSNCFNIPQYVTFWTSCVLIFFCVKWCLCSEQCHIITQPHQLCRD